MKLVTAETMQKAERLTMDSYPIPGQVLMEIAGRACADHIDKEYGPGTGKSLVVVAGKGNNGGDGYVIARCLKRRGWAVSVFVIGEQDSIGGDAGINLSLLDPSVVHFCPGQGGLTSFHADFQSASVIVDALFGIGLTKEIGGAHAEAVELVNNSRGAVVAIDIPSGVCASSGSILGCAVNAEMTITFAFAKVGHAMYPGRSRTGKLVVVDIGLPDDIETRVLGHDFLTVGSVRPLMALRDRCGHKGTYGHCLIVAGSTGKTGAAALSANTAVRTGSGLVTLAVPASLNPILEAKTTEAMTMPLEDDGKGHLRATNAAAVLRMLSGKDAVAVGPGISFSADTVALVHTLVRECRLPMVLDADALNAVADDVDVLLNKKSPTVVLTPHPGEMSRLTGQAIAAIEADRIAAARDFAVHYGVHLVLKGAATVVAAPDGCIAVNGSGNPGMASGGMGDVLTGIIVSLLGQGYPPVDACRLGVFLHGHAADLVARDKGEAGITATDVLERIPYAFQDIHKSEH